MIAKAIYRCISRNAAILILDEPTSSLDADIESLIFYRLAWLKCTVLILTHSSSIKTYDYKFYSLIKGT